METKCRAVVKYNDGKYWDVVVVNGFVPVITVYDKVDGGKHYVLDYRCRIPRRKPQPVVPEDIPRVVPRPEVEPESRPISRLDPKLLPGPVEVEPPRSTPLEQPHLSPKLEPIVPNDMRRPSDVQDDSTRVAAPRYEKIDE